MVETTALGAAGLAGLTLGVWSGWKDFLGRRRFTRFDPRMDQADRARSLAQWHRAVGTALAWARARA